MEAAAAPSSVRRTDTSAASSLLGLTAVPDVPNPRPTSSFVTLLDVIPCRYGACCSQPLCPLAQQCPAGTTGFQCAQCTAGFVSIGGQCLPASACPDTNAGLLALAAILAVFVGVVCVAFARFRSSDAVLAPLLLLVHITYFLTRTRTPGCAGSRALSSSTSASSTPSSSRTPAAWGPGGT
jgi:hypothetical protein